MFEVNYIHTKIAANNRIANYIIVNYLSSHNAQLGALASLRFVVDSIKQFVRGFGGTAAFFLSSRVW